jgi:hypothetical protein
MHTILSAKVEQSVKGVHKYHKLVLQGLHGLNNYCLTPEIFHASYGGHISIYYLIVPRSPSKSFNGYS